MPEKIEVTPFIRWDIKAILNEHTEQMFDDNEEDAECEDAVPSYHFDDVVEAIMSKLTEFVKENYTPKK
jgi:hypothetical protein